MDQGERADAADSEELDRLARIGDARATPKNAELTRCRILAVRAGSRAMISAIVCVDDVLDWSASMISK